MQLKSNLTSSTTLGASSSFLPCWPPAPALLGLPGQCVPGWVGHTWIDGVSGTHTRARFWSGLTFSERGLGGAIWRTAIVGVAVAQDTQPPHRSTHVKWAEASTLSCLRPLVLAPQEASAIKKEAKPFNVLVCVSCGVNVCLSPASASASRWRDRPRAVCLCVQHAKVMPNVCLQPTHLLVWL